MYQTDDHSAAPWLGRVARLAAVALLAAGLAAGCSDNGNGKKKNNTTADAGSDTGDVGTDADAGGDASQPQGIHIEGLSAPVKAQVDDLGVLHLDCQTNLDCYAAEGYFHASNRFFEMDLIRRQTRGQLSEVIGSLGLDSDKHYRQLMTTADGTPLEDAYYDALSDKSKAMLDAYTKGVNAWLADMRAGRNGAKLTTEYDFALVAKDNIRDWEPQDTIALYLKLAYQLGESATEDLFRGKMATALDPATAADLFSVRPATDSYTFQASGADPSTLARADIAHPFSVQAMRKIQQRLLPAKNAIAAAAKRFTDNPAIVFGPHDGEDGSNNWVVGPSRTKDGHALLANDPHLELDNPAIWYFIEMDSKTNGQGDLHVAGASIPAVPGIVIGHNDNVAWGVTTAYLDLADAYVETLNSDGTAVMFNGQEVPLVKKDFTFHTSDGIDKTVTFEYVPHHGPLISKDMDNHRGISIRWVLEKPGNDIDFLGDLMVANNVQEAMDALGPLRAIDQNWVFMDRDGSIAWDPKGAIPKRPWASADTPNWLPVPGDGTAEWDGYVAADKAPKLVDPPNGFIATANNDMDGSYADGDGTNDGHTPWQTVPAIGYRHKRIVDLIEQGGNNHTVDTMNQIQSDTYIGHAAKLVPHILAIAKTHTDLSPEAQNVVDALDAWQYTCPTGLDGTDPDTATKVSDATEARESIGCTVFHVMLPYLTQDVFGDELKGVDSVDALADYYILQSALLRVFDAPGELNNGDAYFDDVTTDASVETADDIVTAELQATADRLNGLFGSTTPDDWRWGRIHTVTFSSLFASAGIHTYDNGPFVNDGGLWSVDVANPTGDSNGFDNKYFHTNGPSLRVVFQATDNGIEGTFQLPGGQDNHRDSQFYGSLVDSWLSNTPNRLLYNRDEVDQAAVETYDVEPAQ